MELTSKNVNDVFVDCLWEVPPEDPKKALMVEGITITVGFNPLKVQEHKQDIEEMVEQLPEEFKQGMSFLRGCMRKDGEQWGEQKSVQELFLLGEAAGKMKCLLSRENWDILPGGMPYYQVL